jgi:dolichol-phosphate mannosyltransferase
MLSLVLPTYNEAANLGELVPQIRAILHAIPHEIIVVDDDSPDRTWETALKLARELPELRVIRRIGRRGLSSAVIEGFLAATGDVLAVADADGQHDYTLLPRLYESVRGGTDVAIGSRYVAGGAVGQWDERRHALSRIATRLAQTLCRVQAEDPMSGFFAIGRATFEDTLPRLNPKGFKILLDLLVHIPPGAVVRELPFTFGIRIHGESKLSRRVQLEFLEYLYDVTLGRWIPLTLVKYCIVGSLGIVVNGVAYFVISRLFLREDAVTLWGFSIAVLGAIETAILFNFLLNNAWTFALSRLRGRGAVLGFLKFNAACLVGALANFGVSAFLFSRGVGELASVLGGAAVGVGWNYTINRLLTWRM